MILTAPFRELKPNFENVCRRYPNSKNSEILKKKKKKKNTEIIQNNFPFVEKLQDWQNSFQ